MRGDPSWSAVRTVWKYPIDMQALALRRTTEFELRMPVHWAPLMVDVQGGVPCLWAEVDPSTRSTAVEFVIVGTGFEVPANTRHVGSWQRDGFVWHLYERI